MKLKTQTKRGDIYYVPLRESITFVATNNLSLLIENPCQSFKTYVSTQWHTIFRRFGPVYIALALGRQVYIGGAETPKITT